MKAMSRWASRLVRSGGGSTDASIGTAGDIGVRVGPVAGRGRTRRTRHGGDRFSSRGRWRGVRRWIGANAAIATVAIGVGAVIATMPFGQRVRRYGLGGMLAAILAGAFIWDGNVTRIEGAVLVAGDVAFVAVIWRLERQPPALGETAELHEARPDGGQPGRDLLLVLIGLAALTVGSMALVEGVRPLSGIESTQTRLGLVVVEFATAFELVVLAGSAGRRGMTDAVVAGVVGSYAYNVTMSLGAGAMIAPVSIARPDSSASRIWRWSP
jgi:cation:H+ antiporter